MQQEILQHLNNPRQLEQLYRDRKSAFASAFREIYPQIRDTPAAAFWQERLALEQEGLSFGSLSELKFVILATFLSGCVAKIPDWLHLEQDQFFQRNLAFVIFPFLTAWFSWKHRLKLRQLLFPIGTFMAAALYINILPVRAQSDSILIACLHLPVFLWMVLNYAYSGGEVFGRQRKLEFIRFNGDLLVMMAVILLAAGIFTGIVFNLFRLIDINIETFFTGYVAVWGGAAIPIVANFWVQTNPQLVNRVSPVIARVFTPLVLVSLLIYLGAILYSGKNPYNDRDFLIIFNAMLVGVLALILFSLTGLGQSRGSSVGFYVLFLLSFLALVINGLVFSAIVYRLFAFGLTPNRLAVAGADLIMLVHLISVSLQLYLCLRRRRNVGDIEQALVAFLPVYGIWAGLVTFVFPLAFGFN